jgi:hypothetical protein
MKERKFIRFKVAAILTLGLLLLVLAKYIYLHFTNHYQQKNIATDLFALLVLSALIGYQIMNLELFACIEKQDYPTMGFIRLHTFLLILNAVCLFLLLVGFAQIFSYRNSIIYRDANFVLSLVSSLILFIANFITIFSSLRLRKYLRQLHKAKEQEFLESFGGNDN